jgi:hypothetical protein
VRAGVSEVRLVVATRREATGWILCIWGRDMGVRGRCDGMGDGDGVGLGLARDGFHRKLFLRGGGSLGAGL